MAKDYLAVVKPDLVLDKVDYGIKGMRWGVNRTDAQLDSDNKKRASSGEDVTPTAKRSSATSTSKPPGEETSSARYARLKAQAKGGGASSMSEADLKFVNARTEALAKIEKLNQSDPSWLTKTTKKVLQQTAQNQLQAITDGLAKKYISDQILNAANKQAQETVPDAIRKGIAEKSRREAIDKGIEAGLNRMRQAQK